MTDNSPSQEASEAWQDVKPFNVEILGFWHRCYSAPEVEHARAADAQQIAALRAENEQLQKRNDNQFSIIQDFSSKLATLQIEDK